MQINSDKVSGCSIFAYIIKHPSDGKTSSQYHCIFNTAVYVLVQCLSVTGREMMLVLYYGLPLTIKPVFVCLTYPSMSETDKWG